MAIALVALLGGCAVLSDLTQDEDTASSRLSGQGMAEETAFPNLGSVPDAAPPTSSAAERKTVTDGLTADRANAEYTGETFNRPSRAIESTELPPPEGGRMIATPSAESPTAASSEPSYAAPAPRAGEPTTAGGSSATQRGGGGTTEMAATPPVRTPPADTPPSDTPPSDTPPHGAGAARTSSIPAPAAEGAVLTDLSVLNGAATPTAPATINSTAINSTAINPTAINPGAPVALIYFTHGSANLSSRDRAVLRDVARLQRQTGASVRVVGHASMRTGTTDPASHEAANLAMSQKRANAVTRQLVRQGVPADRISAAAVGANDPIYYEFMPTGEAGNRRVEIYLGN